MNKCYIEDSKIKQIILKSSNVDIIGSYLRTWIDAKGVPYKYEFKTQGDNYFYYDPHELIIK